MITRDKEAYQICPEEAEAVFPFAGSGEIRDRDAGRWRRNTAVEKYICKFCFNIINCNSEGFEAWNGELRKDGNAMLRES